MAAAFLLLYHVSPHLVQFVFSSFLIGRLFLQAGEMLCVDDPVCSMLCPDDKKSVTSHCINCFRFTRAPLPCDVSGSCIVTWSGTAAAAKTNFHTEKQMRWQRTARQLCYAMINSRPAVSLIFITLITDLLQRGFLFKEMQIGGYPRLPQV